MKSVIKLIISFIALIIVSIFLLFENYKTKPLEVESIRIINENENELEEVAGTTLRFGIITVDGEESIIKDLVITATSIGKDGKFIIIGSGYATEAKRESGRK